MTSKESITEFMTELQGYAGNMAQVTQACQRRIQDLYDCYADNTVHATMTDYRNAIRQKMAEGVFTQDYLRVFVKPEDKAHTRRQVAAQRLNEDLSNRRAIDEDVANKVIGIAENLLQTDSYIDITLGLMILTGRRPIEILKTATFTKVEEPYHVCFEGQAKTRGREDGDRPYNIPVLTNVDIVLNALERLRVLRDFSEVDHREIHNRVSKTLNEKFKRHYGKLLPQCKPTHVRSLYALISYQVFSSERRSFDSYAASILGHKANDTFTAQHYDDFFAANIN